MVCFLPVDGKFEYAHVLYPKQLIYRVKHYEVFEYHR